MDFIVLSMLSGVVMLHLLLIYDIACQWSKNFMRRMRNFPPNLHLSVQPQNIVYAIPKGHIRSHGKACQGTFSLNYLPGSARTDGESVERDWAYMNALVPSTREMGTGNRHETLDDHWGWWNWEKVKKMGELTHAKNKTLADLAHIDTFLHKKLKDALMNHQKQYLQHEELSDTLPVETRQKWDKEIESWNNGQRQTNPYDDFQQRNWFCP